MNDELNDNTGRDLDLEHRAPEAFLRKKEDEHIWERSMVLYHRRHYFERNHLKEFLFYFSCDGLSLQVRRSICE